MNLAIADNICYELLRLLSPHCEKCNVAGSVRRRVPDVKDIEMVCLPKLRVSNDLFGDKSNTSPIAEFTNQVIILGERQMGSVEGRFIKIKLVQDIMLDLFIPQDYDYYRQFAIRTGSAFYSEKVIAGAWVRKGWRGTDIGLRRQKDCRKTSSGWECINPEAEKPPVWQSEQEFFDWLGERWLKPYKRSLG